MYSYKFSKYVIRYQLLFQKLYPFIYFKKIKYNYIRKRKISIQNKKSLQSYKL